MKSRIGIAVATAIVLLAVATSAAAQGKSGGAQKGPQNRPPMTVPDRDMQRDMDRARDMDEDRQRDRDRDRLRDEDMYGQELMSANERERYRRTLENAGSDRERAEIRAKHQEEVMARAREQGRDIEPPVYGQHMMTAEERRRFAERMQQATSNAEREQIRNEHREMILNRARDLGVEPPVEPDRR